MMNDEGKITNYKPQITNKPQKDKEQKTNKRPFAFFACFAGHLYMEC